MKPDYIARFEKLGLGLFVHFGLYSVLEKGEWHFSTLNENEKETYLRELPKKFNPNKNWAKEIVKVAKGMGAKYITLTTRHHEGFSLYDTCGINDFDAPHSLCKRDLVKEFVDECNKNNIVPFFYHTLLDWYNKDFDNDFPKYIDYLIKSVEILCKNYGKIGGLWFDGYWSKPNENWQFDRLYSTIRKYQPEAMIINNTGLSAGGEVTHYEIDSVTFERGKPANVSNADGKDRAGEMCDGITDHWGYAKEDIMVKPVSTLINAFVDCRKYHCNYLINSGPMKNGLLSPLEKYTLLTFGKWNKKFAKPLFEGEVAKDIKSDKADIFKLGDYYYAYVKNVKMSANVNVARMNEEMTVNFETDKKIVSAKYMDNNEKAILLRGKRSLVFAPFKYGVSYSVRVLKFKLK